MIREEVYKAIDSERKYQDSIWDSENHQHSLVEFAVFIESYVTKLKTDATFLDSKTMDLALSDTMRKIAGLAVAALEINGCRNRPDLPTIMRSHKDIPQVADGAVRCQKVEWLDKSKEKNVNFISEEE